MSGVNQIWYNLLIYGEMGVLFTTFEVLTSWFIEYETALFYVLNNYYDMVIRKVVLNHRMQFLYSLYLHRGLWDLFNIYAYGSVDKIKKGRHG